MLGDLLGAVFRGVVAFFLGIYDRWRQRRDAQAAFRKQQLEKDLDAVKRAQKVSRDVDRMSDAAVADELRELDRD